MREKASERWQRLVDEMHSSGKTQRAWCTEQGINYGTMRTWASKLSRMQSTPSTTFEESSAKRAVTPAGWLALSSTGSSLEKEMERPHSHLQIQIGNCFTINLSGSWNQAKIVELCKGLQNLC